MRQLILICSLSFFILTGVVHSLGTDENRELSQWYEQAHSYYSAVQSGAETKPAQAQWNEFLNQMNWAHQQLYGTERRASDPFGGIVGPQGNIIYNEPKTHIGFQGEGRVHDVYSYDFTLDVASTAAKVSVKKTKDARNEPPEEVIKIVVKDPAPAKKSIYYLHNIDLIRSLKINTPGGKNVSDKTRSVKVGKFKYQKPIPLDKKFFIKKKLSK